MYAQTWMIRMLHHKGSFRIIVYICIQLINFPTRSWHKGKHFLISHLQSLSNGLGMTDNNFSLKNSNFVPTVTISMRVGVPRGPPITQLLMNCSRIYTINMYMYINTCVCICIYYQIVSGCASNLEQWCMFLIDMHQFVFSSNHIHSLWKNILAGSSKRLLTSSH